MSDNPELSKHSKRKHLKSLVISGENNAVVRKRSNTIASFGENSNDHITTDTSSTSEDDSRNFTSESEPMNRKSSEKSFRPSALVEKWSSLHNISSNLATSTSLTPNVSPTSSDGNSSLSKSETDLPSKVSQNLYDKNAHLVPKTKINTTRDALQCNILTSQSEKTQHQKILQKNPQLVLSLKTKTAASTPTTTPENTHPNRKNGSQMMDYSTFRYLRDQVNKTHQLEERSYNEIKNLEVKLDDLTKKIDHLTKDVTTITTQISFLTNQNTNIISILTNLVNNQQKKITQVIIVPNDETFVKKHSN
jgi:hypothetical protein